MRRGHKKKRKHSMTFCDDVRNERSPRVNMLRTLTVLSHVAAIIGTIALIVDALHRW